MDPLCASEEDIPYHSTVFENDWHTIPGVLQSPTDPISTVFHHDPSMQVPLHKIHTMDGVAKCWRSLAPDCESLLLQEPDGHTWAMVEPCVASVGRKMQSWLYFFHSLQADITDYALYAVPTPTISLKV